jgi:tetratricopeptide (TPR) repeat protein
LYIQPDARGGDGAAGASLTYNGIKEFVVYKPYLIVLGAVVLGTVLLIHGTGPQAEPAQDQPQAAVAAPAGQEELEKGIQLSRENKHQEAEPALRAAVAAQPDNPKARYHLAVALLENNRLEEAEQEFQHAQAMAEGTPEEQKEFFHNRGKLYAKREKWAPAAEDLQKAIELDPREPYNHYYLGVTYHKLGKPDRMVEHLQMFLRLAPDAPEAPRCRSLLRAVGA